MSKKKSASKTIRGKRGQTVIDDVVLRIPASFLNNIKRKKADAALTAVRLRPELLRLQSEVEAAESDYRAALAEAFNEIGLPLDAQGMLCFKCGSFREGPAQQAPCPCNEERKE